MTDNSDIVSAKVIIDKELFERMRRIIEYHKEHCKNSDYGDAVTKGGGGPVGPYGDQASVRKKNDTSLGILKHNNQSQMRHINARKNNAPSG